MWPRIASCTIQTLERRWEGGSFSSDCDVMADGTGAGSAEVGTTVLLTAVPVPLQHFEQASQRPDPCT